MDQILYRVISAPGGVDGLDYNAKGGRVLLATFDKVIAERKIGVDSRMILDKSVIDTTEAIKTAKSKLDLVDKLVLEIK